MPRYSSRPLPEARYLPGRSLHPGTDSGGRPIAGPEQASALDPDGWETCEDYLYGIDLFNHAYWWEAHEAFEGLWRAAGRTSPVGQFLQGLIQIAAALLKLALGSRAAAEGLASSGCRKLRGSPGVFLGIDTGELASSVEAYIGNPTGVVPRIDLALA